MGAISTRPDEVAGVRPQQGCLLLADISGYTAYLVGSELEHAHDVLADLTDTLVRSLTAGAFRVNEIEGDAVFVVALGERIDPAMLLDTVAVAYGAFRNRLQSIARATTCDCNACLLVPKLDLKFVAHHGRFTRRVVAGSERLTGTDVIVVHRLLKNGVVERLGITAYGFYTDACVAAMDVDPEELGWRRHEEALEGVGEIGGWVEDLDVAWRTEQEQRRVRVDPKEALADAAIVVPVTPPVAWEYLTRPDFRLAWQPGTTRLDQTNPSGGRRGVGSSTHCVHGRAAILEEIVDWRPFDYFTLLSKVSTPAVPMVRMTFELTPEALDRTRVRLLADVRNPSLVGRLLLPRVSRTLQRNFDEALGGLARFVSTTRESSVSDISLAGDAAVLGGAGAPAA